MFVKKTLDIRQKIIAVKTSRGWYAPHVPYVFEVDVTKVIVFLSKINSTAPTKINLNTLLVYIIVNGIKSCPVVNAHIHYNKWFATGHIKLIENIDVSMPVLLPDGKMIAINLLDFGNKKLMEMQDYIRNIMEKIKNTDMDVPLMKTAICGAIEYFLQGDLIKPILYLLGLRIGKDRIKRISGAQKKIYGNTPSDERINKPNTDLGTVLITNLGAALKNIRGFPTLISLLSPQVFSVGIGSMYDEPVVKTDNDKNEISIAKKIQFCLTFDHRALDFGDIVPFIKRIDEVCKDPEKYIELN